MAKEVVEKRKGLLTCADCKAEMAPGMDKCPECGSTNIKKSIIIIRKETSDVDDELDTDEVDEDDDDSDEDDEDEEEDDEDSEDDEDDDEDVVEPVVLEGVGKRIAFVEALNLSTALAEGVTKILTGDISKAATSYEDVMTEFNTVMDTAFEQWVSGDTISKADALESQSTLIHTRVNNIIKEGGAVMPNKITRPESFDSAELPDDLKAYIESLESAEPVEKKDDEEEDIFKGLTPKAAEIVRKAAETNEQSEADKFITLAKSYTHIPGEKVELAKSLRKSSESDPEGFKVLTETLAASNENLKQSDIFKAYGRPGHGDSEVSKNHTAAEELVSKGDFDTIEQAEVSLMGGADYQSTVTSN